MDVGTGVDVGAAVDVGATVAVLDGYATGGGAHLALACDLRTASQSAWLQFPSARYGLTLGSTWLARWVLPGVFREASEAETLNGLPE